MAKSKKRAVSFKFPKSLPVSHRAEVLVCGAGPGGLGAAVSAARAGRDTLIVERYGFPGGMATAGEVNPFMHNHLNGVSMDIGVYTEWLDRMKRYGGVANDDRTFDPFAARLAAEDMLIDAGVRMLYHHQLASASVADRRINGLAFLSKSGMTAATADIYIDSTGDGDLAAAAGCECLYGSETAGQVQPMTLCFKVILDPADFTDARTPGDSFPASYSSLALLGKYFQQIQESYKEGQASGRIKNPRGNVLMFRGVDKNVVHFNSTRVINKSPIDGGELSAAEIEARAQLRELIDLLKEKIPAFKNARIVSIATQIGIRESRRVSGLAFITRSDFEKCSKFPDGIARVNYPIDIHSPTGGTTEITKLPEGEWYEIPYGCIVPKDIDNLLMACRAISADHAAHSSLRVMPPVCSIGQAAGMAAAMAIEQSVAPKALDGMSVRKRLIESGRNLA